MRSICVVTGSRAEYGLLSNLMKKIYSADDLKLQVIVTGMHLSPEFGLTYKQIENDGFFIDYKIEALLSSNTEVGVGKSIGLSVISFVDAIAVLKPDVIVLLGDRFEAFAAASAAAVMGVPIAHIHGGEVTEGAIDELFRHAITKMAQLHFTSTEEYRNRVLQLGENPRHVFCVGAPGVENIKQMALLARNEVEQELGVKLKKRNLLITFHPETRGEGDSKGGFLNLLQVLDRMDDVCLIFTKANSDVGGRDINHMIESFVSNKGGSAVAYDSLGQLRYLSVVQYVDAVVGNSSSGLIEAPSFKIGTINIGNRQRGRIRAKSVIDCEPDVVSIERAFDCLYGDGFSSELSMVVNPYEGNDTSGQIVDVLSKCALDELRSKPFYDLGLEAYEIG